MAMINKIRKSYLITGILPKIKNKYVLTVIGFLVWISFFDRNDLISQHAYKNHLHKLNDEKTYYVNEISKNRKDLNDLVSSKKNLEKFAREKYLMKRENEDIFIFVEVPVSNTDKNLPD